MNNKSEVLSKAYSILLQSNEWLQKRNKILDRDAQECQNCHSPASIWIPNSGENGGTHIVIIENNPISEFPKEIKKEVRYLQVHHHYYILENNKLVNPWEYEDSALITVCHKCHFEIHQTQNIKILSRINGTLESDENYQLCDRCGGEGYLPEFNHVQNGICFKCWGQRIFKKHGFLI